jgi:hypothetical protein
MQVVMSRILLNAASYDVELLLLKLETDSTVTSSGSIIIPTETIIDVSTYIMWAVKDMMSIASACQHSITGLDFATCDDACVMQTVVWACDPVHNTILSNAVDVIDRVCSELGYNDSLELGSDEYAEYEGAIRTITTRCRSVTSTLDGLRTTTSLRRIHRKRRYWCNIM